MKTSQNRIGRLLGTLVLGACLGAPVALLAQEPAPNAVPPPPPPRENPGPPEVPQDHRMSRVLGQVEALHRLGKHDEAMQLERRVRSATSGAPMMMPPGELRKPERRDKMQAERRMERQPGQPGQPIPPQAKIQHLRQAAEHLQAAGYGEYADKARKEIGRLEEQVRSEAGPRVDAGMKEEFNKLRREMEELRQQLRKLKAEAKPKHDPAPPHPEGKPQ